MSQNYEQLLENVSGKLLPDHSLNIAIYTDVERQRRWIYVPSSFDLL